MEESVEWVCSKREIWDKNIFSDNKEGSSKKLCKMVVKANLKQEIKELVAALTNFYKKNLQNLKYNVKRMWILHLILAAFHPVWYC